MELDDVDRRIIEVLRDDGRASYSAVAQAVNISRASAYNRIARLTDQGVITGFTVETTAAGLGLHSSAYVMLRTEQASWQQVLEGVLRIPEVKHVALVTGDFDVILLVRARDNEDLRRVVLGELRSIGFIRDTRTVIMFEEQHRH